MISVPWGAEHLIEAEAELRVAVAQQGSARVGPAPLGQQRLRACWATQAPSRLAVTPARWTRRVSSSMKHRGEVYVYDNRDRAHPRFLGPPGASFVLLRTIGKEPGCSVS